MAYLYGTDTQHGAPVTLEFSFNGASTPWGTANLYSMAPLSNRAEAIDGGYEISNLSVELIDTNGSIWGSLGHGTTAFNKEFSATVYIGGSMNMTSYGPSGLSRLQLANRTDSATFTVHQGKITEVSRRNRLVRISSQNNLRNIADLEWRFPYATNPITGPTVIGSYVFYSSNVVGTFPNSVFDRNEDGNEFSMYAAVGTVIPSSPQDFWPFIPGKGTLGRLNGYWYPGTQFYTDLPVVKFKGTWLGTYVGTIDDDVQANRFGYQNVAQAEAGRIASGGGTRYILNRTRVHVNNGTLPGGSHLYPQQNLTLSETPANLFRELIAGHCVTPYFGTDNIEPASFATSVRNTTYQAFSQRIDPKGGKVIPYIKDLIDSVYGLFAVNTQNQFEFRAYGPRNLQQAIGTIDGTNLLDSSIENKMEDAKNRVVVGYNYDYEANEFHKKVEIKGSSWTGSTDNPLILQSKWLRDDNEVSVFAQRLLNRFKNTIPMIEIQVPLKYAGINLGSLFQIVDPDTELNGKTLEITSYSKDFTEDKKITFRGVDGDVLYNRKGFGFWGPALTLPGGAVSGTSTFGWGTAGTVPNINSAIYGSCFVWW